MTLASSLNVVRDLIDKYPHVDARISLGKQFSLISIDPLMSYNGYRAGEEIVRINPKTNNLMEAYRTVKYDILWAIDSNV